MPQPPQNTSISLSTRLLCYLGPPSAILLISSASPKTALLSPLALVPTALAFKQWQKSNEINPSSRGKLEPMIWIFASVGTLGLTTVTFVQFAIVKTASALLFTSTKMKEDYWKEFKRSTIDGLTTDQLTRRSELAASWQNWVLIGLFTFVAAGLVEETLKYLPIAYARRRETPKERKERNRAYIDYAVAGALSFGLLENIGYIYVACESSHEAWPKLLLTVFERSVLGGIGHLTMGALTALRAIRRDCYGDKLSWLEVVGPAILFHGTYDFVAFAFSASDGNVGWIHPAGVKKTVAILSMAFGLIGTALWRVREEWKTIESYDQAIRDAGMDGAQK